MNLNLTPVRFFERAVKLFHSNTAVVCQGHRWTYAEYGERVERLANALTDLGVNPSDKVAYLGYNCHRLLECYYGVVKTGGVLLPINIRLSPEDIKYIVQDARPKVLLVDHDFLGKIEANIGDFECVRHFILLNNRDTYPKWVKGVYDRLLDAAPPGPQLPPGEYPFQEDDVAEIFYTSGTTGPPKGVMLTHRNLYLHALSTMAVYPMAETDIQLHLIPLFHVNGWGIPHFLTAKGGAHVMLQKFSPAGVLESIEKERITRMYVVPTMVNDILSSPELSAFDVSSMKEILIGGAPPPTGMCAATEKVFGCIVHSGFGATETCPMLAAPELPPDIDPETYRHRAHETWGIPVIGSEFRIVDESGNDLPWDGEAVGELLARGDNIMLGYLNKEEETAKTLAGGWYHTGDLASIDADGALYIRDRKKDIIISGGENISSLEIEQVLYTHPAILECAVISKRDDRWGEIPLAVVVLKPGATAEPSEFVTYTKERMSSFKALKEAVIIDEMPRGGTGKILKSALRKDFGG